MANTQNTKIKYSTRQNGEYKEFPLTRQTIILPNGLEIFLWYDPTNNALVIGKISDAP